MFKILCTGNPNKLTLAKAIKEILPETHFIHLSVGYDFKSESGFDKFTDIISEYNVFINSSRIDHGVQERLLRITRTVWDTGHVFNIGSVLENDFFSWFSPEGAASKIRLRQLSLDLSSAKFKTTHIVTGGFTDSSDDSKHKMNPVHIAKTIKWIMNEPDIHIPIIGIENDYWINSVNSKIGEWHQLKKDALKRLGRNYEIFR